MSNRIKIVLLFSSMLMILSCAAFQPKYLSKDYIDNLKNNRKSGIIACVSDRNLDRSLAYEESSHISDADNKWVKAGVNPKRVLYFMLLESSKYMFQECKDPNSYDIMIIPNITTSSITRINSTVKRTGDQNETIYGKEYNANLGINIRVIDKKQNEILNINKSVNNSAWGYERVPPTCTNCNNWANETSIRNGATNAVSKAIYDVLPAINDQISGHDSIVQLEKAGQKKNERKQ